MVFLVVIYRWLSSPVLNLDHEEGWALKNWCFQTVVLEKTLESPLDSKEFKSVSPKWNQSWIFNGRTHLKLLYFGHLMWRANLLEKTLMLGKIEGRRKGQQRMRWLDGIIDLVDMSSDKLWDVVKDSDAVHGVTKSRTQPSNWTTMTLSNINHYSRILTSNFCVLAAGHNMISLNPSRNQPSSFLLNKRRIRTCLWLQFWACSRSFALFFLAEYANITIINMFFTILFIGAFHNPHKPEIYSILLPKSSS